MSLKEARDLRNLASGCPEARWLPEVYGAGDQRLVWEERQFDGK